MPGEIAAQPSGDRTVVAFNRGFHVTTQTDLTGRRGQMQGRLLIVAALVFTANASAQTAERSRQIAVMETAFQKKAQASSLLDAKRSGYDAIQMHSGMPEAILQKPIPHTLDLPIAQDPHVLASWKEASRTHGVQIVSLCAGSLNRCEIWDRDRDVAMRIAKQTIDACHELAVPTMLFPFFGPSKFQDDDKALKGVADFMKQLLPYAQERDVVIGIEAPVTTKRVLELLELLGYPTHLKIYYDTGNLYAIEDIYEAIRRHARRHFCEIHIKAFGSKTVGQGQIDLAKLAAALDAAKYDRWLVYEANRNGRDPVANLAAIKELLSLRQHTPGKIDVESSATLPIPPLSTGPPAAGKRVKVTSQEYQGTDVFHTLYLPKSWRSGGPALPIIFEYTGNYFPASGSSGKLKDAALGYGLSGGEYIWVCLPYVNESRSGQALTWWGDAGATVEYAKRNVPRIVTRVGADTNAVFLCGFSRGAIGVNYLGLHDREVAKLWTAFVTHDHFDGVKEWKQTDWGTPLKEYREGAIQRLQRVGQRPYLVSQNGEGYGTGALVRSALPAWDNFTFQVIDTREILGDFPNEHAKSGHTDRWLTMPSADRQRIWAWMNFAAGISPAHALAVPTPEASQTAE